MNAYEGWRYGSTRYSRPQMEVSDQIRSPAALPPETETTVPMKLDRVWAP